MQVTAHYSIPGVVPFLDVDVSSDKPLFVDPHAIRLTQHPQPFAAEALSCMQTFFHEVAACSLSQRATDHRRGLELLQKFEEPWETRLGLAVSGFQGHGGSDKIGEWIWHALTHDVQMLVRVGILTQIEEVPLFVEGIAQDITSDLTTRIIFEPLARFTADVLARYPQFTSGAHTTQKVERQVWDPIGRQWTTATVELPVADGRVLLLVPRGWARGSLLLNAGRFYDTSVLSYAQREQAIPVRRGTGTKLVGPGKDSLREQEALARGRATIVRVVLRAHDKGENLLEAFKAFVDGRYEPLGDEVIKRKLT